MMQIGIRRGLVGAVRTGLAARGGGKMQLFRVFLFCLIACE